MSMRVAVAVVAVLVAACHDSSSTSETAVAVAPAPAAARAAPPNDFSIGPGLEMRRPIRDGHLTIIPIVLAADPPATPSYLSVDDAMTRKLITVREIGSYTAVRVNNTSEQPLLVMAGELVLGGEQDHAFGETRIIAAGDSTIVPVYCVEKGRSAGGRKFRSGHALVDVGLRRIMRFGNQQQVWSAVDAINARLGLAPPTSTYRNASRLQFDDESSTRRNRIAAQLDDPRIVGLAAAFDGEVIAVDRFTTPALYRAHQDELLGSYVAGDDGAHHEGKAPSPDDVRRLAATAAAVRVTDASFEALAKPAI